MMAKVYGVFGVAVIVWFLYHSYYGLRMFDVMALTAAKHDPNARNYHK